MQGNAADSSKGAGGGRGQQWLPLHAAAAAACSPLLAAARQPACGCCQRASCCQADTPATAAGCRLRLCRLLLSNRALTAGGACRG